MSRRCLKIGLTGGIGSGKTTVSNLFAELGAPVIDADVIARDLLKPGTRATRQVIDLFGTEIAAGADTVDRNKLRTMVFGNEEARSKLEGILHPMVHDEILERSRSIDAPYCVIVIPLLFEAGHHDLVDRVLVVDADVDKQINRATKRDKTDPAEIQKIIDSQIPGANRVARADDVISNNGSIDDLKKKVQELDDYYRSFSSKSRD